MIKTKEEFNFFDNKIVFEEAEKLGLNPKKILKKDPHYGTYNLFQLKHKKHIEYFVWQCTSQTSFLGYILSSNKYLAKKLLKENNISVPNGNLFDINKKLEITKFTKKIGYPIVVKQISGTHGDLVFPNITNKKQLNDALKHIAKRKKSKIIIEEHFKGKEYRLFATKNKFLAATYRIPANVIGDGKNTISNLIKTKNSDPRREDHKNGALIDIKIDSEVKRSLKKYGYTLETILKKGEQVFLRENSNLSTGGDSIDYTDKIHPSVKKIAVKAINSIPGITYAGVDFITKDVIKKQTKNSYRVIELNFTPMLSMHHYPYEGKSRNVAKGILLELFPELNK